MIQLLLFLLSMAIIAAFGFALRNRFSISPELALFSALCGIILFQYPFLLFGIPAFANLLAHLIGLALLARLALVPSARAELRSFCTPGVIFWFVAGAGAFVFLCGRPILTGDDFTFWGYATKQLLLTGSWQAQAHTFAGYYPPGIQLLHAFFTAGIWPNEGLCLVANAVLIISALSLLWSGLEGRRWVLLPGLLGLVICWLNWGLKLNALYVDSLQATLLAMTLLGLARDVALGRDARSLAAFGPVLAVSALIKPTGVIFAAIPLLYALLIVSGFLYSSWRGVAKRGRERLSAAVRASSPMLIAFLSSAAMTLFAIIAWKWYIALNQMPTRGNFTLANLAVFSPEFYRHSPKQALYHAFFNRFVEATLLPFAAMLVFLVILPFFLRARRSRRAYRGFVAMLLIFAVIYLLGLFLTYYFAFNAWEDLTLNAYYRYVHRTILLALSLGILAIGIGVLRAAGVPDRRRAALACLVAAPLLVWLGFSYRQLLHFNDPYYVPAISMRADVAERIDSIRPLLPADAKVWAIWQDTYGLAYYMTRYELAPLHTNWGSWELGKPTRENPFRKDVTAEVWQRELISKGFTHLLVMKNDPVLMTLMGGLVREPALPRDQLFRIEQASPGKIELVPVRAPSPVGP